MSSRTTISTHAEGPTTSGRVNRPCAASGATTIASVSGHTTGPPAEKEYAVEPVGVDRIIPSAP